MATMIPPPSRDIFRAPSKTWILSFGLRAPVSNRIILTGGSRWWICIRWYLQILKRIYFYRTSKEELQHIKNLFTNSNKLKQMWKLSLFQKFLLKEKLSSKQNIHQTYHHDLLLKRILEQMWQTSYVPVELAFLPWVWKTYTTWCFHFTIYLSVTEGKPW